jgi:serine/threonine protein kinase
MEQVAGPVVGRYEIVRPIGEGGMAQVYLCVRRGAGGFEKQIVLKVLHSKFIGDNDYVQMFLDEARLLARLQHPNIVSVFEVECVEGIPYLAMEYVNGPTLGRLHKRAVRSNLCDHGYMLHIVYQVCLALHHAHTLRINGAPAGVVHRDVSTQNILIEAETGVAKLIDFGIAKMDEGQEKTQVGVLKGKIHYMAPEVLQGARPDARADLYAVGVLLYRLITNRLPFAEGDDIWAARVSGRYPKASEVCPDVSPQIEAILDRALKPDPKDRYQTAAELAADLQAEVERLGTDPSKMAEWLRQVFPSGEDEWSKRIDPNTMTTGTMHTALNQILTDMGTPSRLTPPMQQQSSGVLGGALAGTLVVLLFVLLVGAGALYQRPAQAPSSESAVSFLDAADQLLREQNFDAARTMNAKADALGIGDANIVVRIARQKNDIARESALMQARSQMQSGHLEEARATLSQALELNPSDQQIVTLFSELDTMTKPPPAPVVPEPAPVVVAPPEPERRVVVAPPKAKKRNPKTGKPEPVEPEEIATGVIHVMTSPPAIVYFDGSVLGQSPMTIEEVAVGAHVIEAELAGYPRQRTTVEVIKGKIAPVQLVLQPTPAPAPVPTVEPQPAPVEPAPVAPAPAPKPVIKQADLPSSSSVTTRYAFHEAMAPIQQALIEAGIDPAYAKGVLANLEESCGPRFEAGQSVYVNPRAIYEFTMKQIQSGAERKDVEANLRKAFRVGSLN